MALLMSSTMRFMDSLFLILTRCIFNMHYYASSHPLVVSDRYIHHNMADIDVCAKQMVWVRG